MYTILHYLSELKENNNREWYHANKAIYQEAHTAFLAYIQALILEIGKTDTAILHNNPKDLTFKLVRDTRFSADKSPYNPCFRAHIASKGKLPVPVGYFLFIKPNDESFLGGGLFADIFKDATKMIRDYISENGTQWEQIITSPAFKKHFTLKGTALKHVPKGYDPAHPQAEYLKYKNWFIEYPIHDSQLTQTDFVQNAAEVFSAMQPFHDFLNQALTNFEMPKRP